MPEQLPSRAPVQCQGMSEGGGFGGVLVELPERPGPAQPHGRLSSVQAAASVSFGESIGSDSATLHLLPASIGGFVQAPPVGV